MEENRLAVNVVARDAYGVTDVSLNGLEQFLKQRKPHCDIMRIEFFITPENGYTSRFIASDASCYEATGFAWGYGGEGPHGLVKAIRMCGFEIEEEEIFGWKGREGVLTRAGFRKK